MESEERPANRRAARVGGLDVPAGPADRGLVARRPAGGRGRAQRQGDGVGRKRRAGEGVPHRASRAGPDGRVCPDGGRLVTAGADGNALIWRLAGGHKLIATLAHPDPLVSASFSPDGGRVVTASVAGLAQVSDAASGAALLTLKGHTSGLAGAVYSPDGSQIATASDDGTAVLWDAVDRAASGPPRRPPGRNSRRGLRFLRRPPGDRQRRRPRHRLGRHASPAGHPPRRTHGRDRLGRVFTLRVARPDREPGQDSGGVGQPPPVVGSSRSSIRRPSGGLATVQTAEASPAQARTAWSGCGTRTAAAGSLSSPAIPVWCRGSAGIRTARASRRRGTTGPCVCGRWQAGSRRSPSMATAGAIWAEFAGPGQLVTAGGDDTVRVVDASTGTTIRTFQDLDGRVMGASTRHVCNRW